MDKKIITELERAREIMGLEPQTLNVISEQRQYVDDFMKLFSKTMSKETAEALSKRLDKLLSRTANTKLSNIFKRMNKVGNTKITKSGAKYIVSDVGSQINVTTIEKIIKGVSDGSISPTKLEKLIKVLPERLADGTAYRASFGTYLRDIQKKVTKEAQENIIKKKGGGTIKNKKFNTNALEDITADAWVLPWKDFKSFIFGGRLSGVAGMKQSALKSFMNDLPNASLTSLQKELKVLAKQSTHKMERSVDELIWHVGNSIERRKKIPPEVMDDIIGILLRSDANDDMIKYLYKHSTGAIRRRAKAGKLTPDEIANMLGGKRNASPELIGEFLAKLEKWTVGGSLIKLIPKTRKSIMWTLGGITVSVLLDQLIQTWITLTASNKSIAGVTEQLYKKFQGNKDAIYSLGGLTDDEAEILAEKLHVYFRGWMLIRDFNESSNMKELIGSYPHRNGSGNAAESIADIPNNKREDFKQKLEAEMADYDEFWVAETSTFHKWLSGVDDNSIEAVVDAAPTVLAMSQITYFYNKIGKTKLVDDLGLMNSKIPLIGTIYNMLTTSKQDVLKWVGDKEWLVGSDASDDSIDDVVKMLTDFWPEYAEERESELGDTVYCRYKPGAYISTDNLSRIASCNDYNPEGDEASQYENDFQEFLNALSSERFNAGQCCGIPSAAKCAKAYFTTDPNNDDIGRRSGAAIKDIQAEFSNIVRELKEAFDDGGFSGVKDKMEEWNKEKKETSDDEVEVDEGLINVLNTK